MRKQHPNHKFIDDDPNLGQLTGTVDDAAARDLVKKWSGREEYLLLEQAITECTGHLED